MGDYKGYSIRVKGDGRVQATQDVGTAMFRNVTDARHWIDLYHPDDPPVVTSLNPTSAEIGGVDVTLHVIGTGFTGDCAILFNNAPEPTTLVSATELTTVVKPSLAEIAIDVPVAVKLSSYYTSPPQTFSFTAPA
jgi:hypothetical protein